MSLHLKECKSKRMPQKLIVTFIFIFILSILKVESTECPKDRPILISSTGECKLEYCSKEQFDSKDCILNNAIIKTQWINNIIIFAEHPYRYLGYGSYSNGDFVIESTCYPENPKRKFYGIKSNGRPFFLNKTNNEETPYYSKNITGENNKTLEFKGTIIKLSDSENNGKEYYLSLSKLLGNAELYDFDNDEVYHKTITDFTKENVQSLRHTFFEISSTDSQYYYIFGFISYYNNVQNKINIQKHIFNSFNSFETTDSFTNEEIEEENAYGKEISCFMTESGLINCFTMHRIEEKLYYYFIKYENDFTDKISSRISSNVDDDKTFYKCIHLKKEAGVYAYYYNNSNLFYPVILFRQFNRTENKLNYFLSSEYSSSGVMLNKYNYLNNLLLNDIIKISENRVAFSSVGVNKDILYIILINLYGEDSIKLKIRYYLVKLYALYHYKILLDIKLINYKKILTIGLSLCDNENCSSDNDEHFVGLILFGFPNGTDSEFNLDKYFLKNNINFSGIEIDLKNQLNIENNIFGYILSSITINDLLDCGDYKLYSSKYENNEIGKNYSLSPDENIKIKYAGPENYYPNLNCKIGYVFKATEPEIDIYNNFTDEHEGENEDEYFEHLFYYGRLSYLNIKLNSNLSSLCEDNCILCLKGSYSSCIVCKYNYSTYEENEEHYKICYNENIDITTGMPSNIVMITTEIFNEKEKDMIETEGIIDINSNTNEGSCSSEDIINNKCVEGIVSEEQINDLYGQIKDYYIQTYYNKNNISNTIIQTENAIFQISKLEDQYNSDNFDISNIHLGECEERLKLHYQIINDSLIIYKIDIKTSDMSQTYVQYEIYNPKNFSLLDLSICDDLKISISAPVLLNNYTSSLYDSLKESGYNLFNYNDSFYNDICSAYTTENNTDITLNDRKKIIFSQFSNISLCQNDCEVKSYNSSNKKIMCSCSPQKNDLEDELISTNDKFTIKEIPDSFIKTLKNSNFVVLKCYELAFDFKDFGKNIGRIFMTIIIALSLIFLLVFCFCNFRQINHYIAIVSNIERKFSHNNEKLKTNKTKPINSRKKSSSKFINSFSNRETIYNKKENAPPKKTINRAKSQKLLKTFDTNLTSKRLLDRDTKHPTNILRNKINNQLPNINIIRIDNLSIKKAKKKETQKVKEIKESKKPQKIKKTIFSKITTNIIQVVEKLTKVSKKAKI